MNNATLSPTRFRWKAGAPLPIMPPIHAGPAMLYAIVTFVSAFLLFLVQPLLGKFLMPWFGGAPAVWTTCMLFFQVMLLLGYLYAHLTDRLLGLRRQVQLHAALLFASLLAIAWLALAWGGPLLPGVQWRPRAPDAPVANILRILAAAIGLPFFLLAATSPLLQRWRAQVERKAFPYRLYALSNAGSLLGLLCFPFVLEPAMGIPAQAILWTALYGLFAASCALLALRVGRGAAPRPAGLAAAGAPPGEAVGGLDASHAIPDDCPPPIPGGVCIAFWLILPACASAMLLAATNQMCQEIATVPFLWVLPLSLYLLSFILCFQSPANYRRDAFLAACAVLSLVVLTTQLMGVALNIPVQVVSLSAFLFVFCTVCHGELVRLRPGPRRLTLFYLTASCGGALGGVFVAIVAPRVFAGFWEFHVTLLAGWLLLICLYALDVTSPLRAGSRLMTMVLLTLLCYIAVGGLMCWLPVERVLHSSRQIGMLNGALATGGAALLARLAWRRRWLRQRVWSWLMAGVIVVLAEGFLLKEVRAARLFSLKISRNFYGVLLVQDRLAAKTDVPVRHLMHGRINHGCQFLIPELRRRPAGYCVHASGVGLALDYHPRRAATRAGGPRPLRIGVTGLGVGALAAYAGSNDLIRFYEINPDVIAYAAGPQAFFSYVGDCAGRVEVVPGDARLSQEHELREGGAQGYDVLILDAFSSDSVPVHLLTVEAFATYVAHLRDRDSIIAVNITNRFLDLRPLIFSVADRFGLEAGLFPCAGEAPLPVRSLWVLLTRNRAFYAQDAVRQRRLLGRNTKDIFWTDNYSDLFHLLRW